MANACVCEFTLQGSGITGTTGLGGATQLPLMFYSSIAVAIASLAGIICLRYFRKQKPKPE